MADIIPVTKPFMPPIKKYQQYLYGIWKREYLTNNGPLVQQLETKLEKYLDVQNLLYVNNGTMALQLAIKALGLKGEIITTPFSYVATTSSIVWEGCTPVFVDIEPNTLNIDPNLIERAVTKQTSAIIATHVFGNPCNIDAIQKIAERHNLKVIYDAAHCFGTSYKGKSIYNYGDISTASFHATKLYHTIEGGAVITSNSELHQTINRMRNFGHAGPGNFDGVGINGKNSEFHAAMGLCNLDYIDKILHRRKQQWLTYYKMLNRGFVTKISIHSGREYNFAYFPVFFQSVDEMLWSKKTLEENNIYPRQYFYPSLNELDYVEDKGAMISSDISKRILCLPLYHTLKKEQQESVVEKLYNMVELV